MPWPAAPRSRRGARRGSIRRGGPAHGGRGEPWGTRPTGAIGGPSSRGLSRGQTVLDAYPRSLAIPRGSPPCIHGAGVMRSPVSASAVTGCVARNTQGRVIMKKLVWGAMIASGLSLFAIRTASAQPADVKIYDVGHSGTGCPAGSVDWNISQNSSSVFLGFDAFVAETSASVTSARKNCQIVMDLRFDPAWSFTVFRVDYRGFADLDAGV